jgi:hypothetical protein
LKSIQDDIKDKTARYRGLKGAGIPFIVAIGTDHPLIDWESMFTALYGDEQMTLAFEGEQIVGVKNARLSFSGKITPSLKSEARHRNLSAAWLVRWLVQDDDIYAEVVHFPNPWAANAVRIVGRDISRVIYRWVGPDQVAISAPRQLRRLKVS